MEKRVKKHTSGPWEVAPYTDEDIEINIVKDYASVDGKTTAKWMADLLLDNMGCDFREFEANANLISAAPCLLEALEGIKGRFEHLLSLSTSADDAPFLSAAIAIVEVQSKEAIAKAYGETP